MALSGISHPIWPRAIQHILHWLSERTPTQPTLSVISPPLPDVSLTTHLQTDPCGLQLFHLLEHTGGTGGSTLLVDGFYVASILKELHPDAYELLSTVPVPTHAAGEADALFTPNTRNTPILKHEAAELVQVRWNNDDRSVIRDLHSDQVEPWCVTRSATS